MGPNSYQGDPTMATPDVGTSPSARDKRMGLTGPPRVARGGVPTAGLVSVTGPAGGYSGSRRVSSMTDADRCYRPRLLGGIISNHFTNFRGLSTISA